MSDDLIALTMRRGQIFEGAVAVEASCHIRPGSTVIDVGTNFGQMALLFSKMTGPSGTVHAFEADPFICRLLRLNIEANELSNIGVNEAAVWNRDGETLFYPEQDFVRFNTFGSYGIDPNATSGRTVRSMTIDKLLFAMSAS